MSQKRTKGSGGALTSEQHSILLASSHRMSNDVSGFVPVTILTVRIPRTRPPAVINDRKFAVCLSDREQTTLPSHFSRTRFSRFASLCLDGEAVSNREREREREQNELYDH